MTPQMWDDRYAGSDLVWSAGPTTFVEQAVSGLTPGTALDLGAGEGRNALWLAENGWHATAVDFSRVALDRARRLADERLGSAADRLTVVHADVTTWPPDTLYDLVLVVYIHLPVDQRRRLLATAARAVADGGTLVVVAHHTDNLAAGVGGPQDPAVLYTEADITADLAGTDLTIERAHRVARPVQTDSGTRDALDALVIARRT